MGPRCAHQGDEQIPDFEDNNTVCAGSKGDQVALFESISIAILTRRGLLRPESTQLAVWVEGAVHRLGACMRHTKKLTPKLPEARSPGVLQPLTRFPIPNQLGRYSGVRKQESSGQSIHCQYEHNKAP